ncbi:MAG: 4Fe-4S dicluster domain-containing protein [Candidatus Njordarchaeales archaeon]
MEVEMPNELAEKIFMISGQNVYACYQCGKCSAGCPFTDYMDLLPNVVIHKIQLGDERVLEAKTPWICAACFTCSTRCPRNLDISKIMEALRQITLRKGIDRIKLKKLEKIEELPTIALVAASRKLTG